MTEDEAKLKLCILLIQGLNRMRPNVSDSCMASNCISYWRWMDSNRNIGYCSLGGKPEF
jgi:hypothetical protein